jgi:hypothetical protein
MTVLYLTEPGTTLAARSQTLVVRHGTATRIRVPVLRLQRVAVLAPGAPDQRGACALRP